jgi:DNA invertase Pin-like site-specific DNA recombinase
MARYGYARVSTIDQDLRVQEAALRAAGCGIVRAEKVSGTTRDGRAELALLLTFLRPDDTLVVTRIDRLARSIKVATCNHGVGPNSRVTSRHFSRGRASRVLISKLEPAGTG